MNWLKDKKIIVVVSSMLVAVVIVGYILLRDASVLEIKQKTVIYEYGDKVEITAKDLLKNTDKDTLTNTKVENTLEYETDKEYPKLGRYQAIASYKKEKVTIDIEVKDTKAPVFNSCNSVEFIKGIDFNYGQYIVATDLQVVTYDWKKEMVDSNTVGEYTLSVVAGDASSNKATKDIMVRVLDTVDTSANEITTSIDESGNVKTLVTPKPKVERSTPTNDTTTKPNLKSTTPNVCPSGFSLDKDGNCSRSYTYEDESNNPNHQHYSTFISPLFDTTDECEQWADNYLESQTFPWKYNGWGGSKCSCKKYGVDHFY